MDLEQVEMDLGEAMAMNDPIEVTEPLFEVVEETRDSYDTWSTFNLIFFSLKTVLPKTSETIEVLDRTLRENAELGFEPPEPRGRRGPRSGNMFGTNSYIRQFDIERRTDEIIDERSLGWVIGTSLLFECLVLLFCCWLFSRRDF